jgi:hypothetical protein
MKPTRMTLSTLAIAVLAACGGGGSDSGNPGGSDTGGGTEQPVDNGTLDTPSYTGDKLNGFEHINALRVAAGLEPFKQSTKLDAAAQGHSDYMAANGIFDHIQSTGNAGFTGATPQDRISATAANYSATSETATLGANLPWPDVADVFFESVYHRQPLLSNRFSDIGYASAKGKFGTEVDWDVWVFNYGGNTKSKISNDYVLWPIEGSTDQATYFDGESPDPAPDLTEKGIKPGNPVSIAVDADDTIKVDVFSLNCGGQDIAGRILTTDTDVNSVAYTSYLLKNWAFLLPEAPLPAGVTCTATFQGSSSNIAKIVKTWSFTTAAAE